MRKSLDYAVSVVALPITFTLIVVAVKTISAYTDPLALAKQTVACKAHGGIYTNSYTITHCTCMDGVVISDEEWEKITGKEVSDILQTHEDK